MKAVGLQTGHSLVSSDTISLFTWSYKLLELDSTLILLLESAHLCRLKT
jgi:hypothetical protein